jgi:competence protein ComEC
MAATMPLALEIHHVNVGHGDATVIALRDDTKFPVHQYKLLIDASTENGLGKLVYYFVENFNGSEFNLAIASHYHDDHLRGLAEGLGAGIHSKCIMDVGGYDLTSIQSTENPSDAGVAAPNVNPAPYPANPPDIPDPNETRLFLNYLKGVKFSSHQGLERIRLNPPSAKGEYPLGQGITLFQLGGIPVNLACIAGNGFAAGGASRDTGRSTNPNNYCLAFLLTYGAFSYFTGGDLGGGGSGYADHEKSLASWITSQTNHVCAFKSNHHGSDHSNSNAFLTSMRPAVCVTSVGTHKGHKLPGGNFLDRLNATTTIGKLQGFFFTNLADFEGGANRLTKATGLFSNRANTIFKSGPASYMIEVLPHDKAATNSVFSVYTGANPRERGAPIATFNCH